MPGRVEWVERKFAFYFPADVYPEVMERLRGTPPRVEDRVKGIPLEILTNRAGGSWSIQEHVGHLLDVESLFARRFEDFATGAETLTPADMTNRRTEEARHNEKKMGTLLAALRKERRKLINRLEELDPEYFGRSAMHPRLKEPMRLVDAMYFQAEHDDYHLARITDLIRSLHSHG